MSDVARPEPTEHKWRVPSRVIVLKALGAAVFCALIVIGYLNGEGRLVFLAVFGALACLVLTARDVASRTRLTATPAGVMVPRGFAGRAFVSWPEIDRIRVDTRSRYGARWELLEIDTGETVHLFSRWDLGEGAIPAAETLMRMRP